MQDVLTGRRHETGLQQSQELLDAYTSIIRGVQDGTIPSAREFLTGSDALSLFGTEGNELVRGQEIVARSDALWETYRKLGVSVESDVEAWADGDLGFTTEVATLTLREGQSVTARVTTIFHREDGAWKGVHQHNSLSVPVDQEALSAFEAAFEAAVPAS